MTVRKDLQIVAVVEPLVMVAVLEFVLGLVAVADLVAYVGSFALFQFAAVGMLVLPLVVIVEPIVNPYEQSTTIPYSNVPTIREKKNVNTTTNTKYGSNNKYSNQASQLRDLHNERQVREQSVRQTNPELNNKKSEASKEKCIIY